MDNLTLTSDDVKTQASQLAFAELERGIIKVGASIDALSSSGLKRVLKAITQVALAEELVNGKSIQLNEGEQVLVDRIFAFQENVMGFIQLQNEITGNEEKTDE